MEQKQLDDMDESFFVEEFVEDEKLGLDEGTVLRKGMRLEHDLEDMRRPVKKMPSKGLVRKSDRKAAKESAKEGKEFGVRKEAKEGRMDQAVKAQPKYETPRHETVDADGYVEIKPAKWDREHADHPKSDFKFDRKSENTLTSAPKDPWQENEESADMFKSPGTWKVITGIAVVLLVISLFTQGFNFSDGSPLTGAATAELTMSEAQETVLNYVNTYLLQAPFQAEVGASEELDDLYKVTLTVAGQQVDSYLTKDGKLFFPQGFDVAAAEQEFAAPAESGSVLEVSSDDDPVLGNKDAPVTIIEFSDFQCPFCARFFSETFPLLEENYVNTGKVKIVFRDFPLNFHPEAEPAALAAECADEQGKFWEYHDLLFKNQDALSAENYKKWAQDLGLDTVAFSDCLDSQKYLDEVKADVEDGVKYGVTGTPAFFVNGQAVTGAQPYEVFQKEIDAALALVSTAGEEAVPKEDTTKMEEPTPEETVDDVETVVMVPLNAKKWVFSPDHITAKRGETLQLVIVPSGLDFTFAVPELGVEKQISGQTTVEVVASKTGTFQFKCSSCEDWRGMTGTLTVE